MVGWAIVLAVICFGTAGLVGGAVPVNAGWREPADGIEIFVESNGVHTGIVVPKVAAGVDWRPLARPEHLADPRYAGYDHLSFGWGERAFYLETPTWWDVRPTTVLAGAIGSRNTLVHVDHVPRPAEEPAVRRVVLRPAEYRRLAAYIRAFVVPGGRVHRGYGPYDAFYESNGRYSAVRDCNAWTGEALAAAGVRVGAWTPFPNTVLWWF
nr:TIGR02117 family protein [Sphingomonas rubra]